MAGRCACFVFNAVHLVARPGRNRADFLTAALLTVALLMLILTALQSGRLPRLNASMFDPGAPGGPPRRTSVKLVLISDNTPGDIPPVAPGDRVDHRADLRAAIAEAFAVPLAWLSLKRRHLPTMQAV